MESKKCSFCGALIELGTGKMLVKKDGTVFYFCSHKCEKNMRLGRIPRRLTWVRKGGPKQRPAEKTEKPEGKPAAPEERKTKKKK